MTWLLALCMMQFTDDPMVRKAPPDELRGEELRSEELRGDNGMVRLSPEKTPSSLPDHPDLGQFHDDNLHQPRRHSWAHSQRTSGFSLTFMGGVAGRARSDLKSVGTTLGPAGDPLPIFGMFVFQATADIKNHVRVGIDVTSNWTRAFGTGADATGIAIRQAVDYQLLTGGALAEAVFPIGSVLELSAGSSLGGGTVRISATATRIDNFSDSGVDLRAIAKTQTTVIQAPMLHVKPAIGARAKLGHHAFSAIDIRVGLNVYWVPAGAMHLSDDLTLYGSPGLVELQPFITAGIALGDWWARKKD